MFSKLKTSLTSLTLAVLVFVSAVGGLLAPAPAHAQLATLTFGDIPAKIQEIGAEISKSFLAALKIATIRTVAYAVRKVSYDSAVWLASGAKGQNPFAQTEKFGPYLKTLADDAGGTFIEQLSADKLDICHIPDIKVDMAMKIGLRTSFGGATKADPGKPKCSFSQLKDNWSKEFDSKYGSLSTADRLTDINKLFQVDNNSDLGIQLQTSAQLANAVYQQTTAATLERQTDKGFKGKEEPISGKVVTPPSLIEEQFKANTPAKEQEKEAANQAAALASNEPGVISTGLSIFLNTLVSTALTNFREKGVLPTDMEILDGDTATNANSIASGGIQAATRFYRELQKVKINEVANYDVLSQLSSCPAVPGNYNCRAHQDLITAINRAEAGEPVTIQQALNNDWLVKSWSLIPPSSAKNNDKDCYQNAYCYSNIQALRQLRILPLGFEIAAKNSDPDRPWTLEKVVNGFNDCIFVDAKDHSKGIVDDPAGHPFCHLIDPEWVLKSPIAKCKIKTAGPFLISSGVPDRLEDCMDVQTCVQYGTDGTCINYGYCTEEKDTLKFNTKTCAPHAATCRTVTNASGVSASYLARTLDTGFCADENVGCTAYSLTNTNGSWQDPKIQSAAFGNTNTGIYFNANVSKTCSANSQGCSAFLASGDPANTLLYLKKAPDYLKCYGDSWPQSVADLNRVASKADAGCANYAGACIKDEVGCSLYSPAVGGEPVPGRYTPHVATKWNDECATSCVGYDTYREMPGKYSVGQAVSYIIPQAAAVCSAEDNGCTGFTNLSTTSGGLEQEEYFTSLRMCAHPDKEKGKLYITYESSQNSGFQIRTYTLAENNDSANGPIGAPKYFYRDATELQKYLTDCTKERYDAGTASAYCRQFNDEQGRAYYRMLDATIPVTSACTAYRLNNPELDAAGKCLQNGEYRNGSCFYYGLPSGAANSAGASKTCSASVDTCRAYKGTEGGIAGQIFLDNFESTSTTIALSGWSGGVSLSKESTNAKGQSAQIVGTATKKVNLDVDASFGTIFWAKGSGGTITVSLQRTDGTAKNFGTVSVGDTWQEFRLGPIEPAGAAVAGGSYTFTVSGGKAYIDNVALNHSVDVKYLVKNKLTVPAECDSTPNDNLPGEALGCSAYTDVNNNPVALVNFTQLCRAEAIGCTAMLDTQNTVTIVNGSYQSEDEGPRTYNVWLEGGALASGKTLTATVDSVDYSCRVLVGDIGCYLDKPIPNTPEQILTQASSFARIVKSTVYIPADTSKTDPIYLVKNKQATCTELDLGCTAAGLGKINTKGVMVYTTTTIKNNPNGTDGYAKTLCQAEALSCQKYTDTSNSPVYFKEPAKVCKYKTDVEVNKVKTSGWFWSPNGTDVEPCYPSYLQNSQEYGLWSYGNSDKYDNFVGACESTEDKCTEFVDHVKTDVGNPSNNIIETHHLINDPARLNEGDCAGGASLKAGCVLLDQTDNPSKYWSRAASYAASDAADGKPVKPVNSATNLARPNDSNVLLKAIRDRECGQWLSCSYTRTVYDSTIGNFKDVCENIQRCDKNGCGGALKSGYAGSILTEERYRSRTVGWNGEHFSGYSILNQFPTEELADVNFNETGKGDSDYRLVKKVLCGTNNCTGGFSCSNPGACGNGGICVNKTCVRSITGEGGQAVKVTPTKQACRGYLENNAPFPSLDFIRKTADYSLANTCAENRATDGSAYLCDCDYTKTGFGQITKYWNYSNPNAGGIDLAKEGPKGEKKATGLSEIKGICIGGPNGSRGEEKACTLQEDCGPGSICQLKDKESIVLGLKGYCLEQDLTRNLYGDANKHPCLTWYPGKLNGVPDLFNQDSDAGFSLSSFGYEQGPFYCESAELWRYAEKYTASVAGYVDCDGLLADSDYFKTTISRVTSGLSTNAKIVSDVITSSDGADLDCVNQSECTDGPQGHAPGSYFYRADNRYYEHGLVKVECVSGFSPRNVKKFTASKFTCVNSLSNDDEDFVTLDYECVKNGSNPNVALSGPGSIGSWEKVASPPNLTTGYVPKADEEIRCNRMVQISDETAPPVAMTQSIWRETKGKPINACVLNSISLKSLPTNAFGVKITGEDCTVGYNYPEDAPKGRTQMFVAKAVVTMQDIREKFFAVATKVYQYVNATFAETTPVIPAPPAISDEKWNITETGAPLVPPFPPRVVAVGDCPAGNSGQKICLEKTVADQEVPGLTLSINQTFRTDGTILLDPNTPNVGMRFFAYAGNEQMPIRKVSIQWGDGNSNEDFTTPDSPPSFYRNLRGSRDGVCENSLCRVPGGYISDQPCTTNNDCIGKKAIELCHDEGPNDVIYGLLKGKTCNTGYFEFKNHVYTCTNALPACTTSVTTNCYQSSCTADPSIAGACCVFTPRVQVKDNWGWCNGTCGDASSAGGTGCFDAGWKTTNINGVQVQSGINECEISRKNFDHWTDFGGKIIVAQ